MRWQLAIFAVVTVASVTVMAVFFLGLPAALGIGTYTVTANFAASAGLYKNANVTYRGTTIGRVTDVSLAMRNGVDATLRLNSDSKVPSNVVASVRSVSAIGEQYVDLVPPAEPSSTPLAGGSRINRDHTELPDDVATLLQQGQDLINSVNQSRLRDLLQETFTAFDGSGPELARLIESTRLLTDEANAHSADITTLIDQAGPFLDAQIRSGDAIRSLADGLSRLTGNIRNADPQLRSLLQIAPDAAAEAASTFRGIRPSFPLLAANLANFGRIGVIYNKSIEQLLVIVPAMTSVLLTIAQQVPLDEGARADFKLSLQDPPPCSVGFIPPSEIRSPADETVRDIPEAMYCKVPQNDPTAVRGARNYPCQEFPGKRAPTIQLCRDPVGYVPLGRNAWRGPPVPIDTPVTDPRNILPPNKFPLLPPEADYDPGAPVVELPPGVPPGPGPADTPPYPLPVPPVDGPPPPPLPYFAPPDATLPPYNQHRPAAPPPGPAVPPPSDVAPLPAEQQPLAQGAPITTYDPTSGAFIGPDGQMSKFAGGASEVAPAEDWVDLMISPRRL
jgi:phospholipid/cholesterol/gamma-HCH transport system substrate-binding protein